MTARKREERLQDTPISITNFSAAELDAKGIENIGGIASSTPNLSISTDAPIAGASNAAQVFIRGIGQTDFTANTEPGVGIYLDGVYMSHTIGSMIDLIDVDQVEVLRGPQGTLFGRNTIGGAISIASKRPTDTLGASFEISFGDYSQINAKATVNVPVSDKVLVNFSLGTINSDGYVERLPTHGMGGGRQGNQHTIVGRGALELKPIDDLDILLTVDGTRDRAASGGAVPLAIDPNGQFTGFYNAFQAPALVPTLGQQAFYTQQWLAGPRATYGTGPNTSDDSILGTALTVTYSLGAVDIKSITAYRNTQGFFGIDIDGSPLDVSWTTDGYRDEQVSQEFQLSGTALDGALHYVGGLYYFDEKATDTNYVYFPVVYITSGGYNDNSSEAVFGQATYNVMDDLAFTAGLRYTRDVTNFTPASHVISSSIGMPPGLPVLPSTTARASFHDLSPEVNIAYHWTPEIMTYFNFSEGYKSGGFTQRVFPPLPEVPSYAPEYATVYELGFKTTLLGNRLRLNGDVFHTDYTDIQVLVVNGIAPTTENAAAGTIDGTELELTALPVDRLTVTGGLGYTFAHYTKLDPGAQVALGDKFPFTPLWNVSGSIAYDGVLPNSWHVRPRIDMSYRATQYYDAVNSPSLRQPGYFLANLSLTVSPPSDNPQVFFRVDNVTDKLYLSNGIDALSSQGLSRGIYGPPLTFLGGIRAKF